MNNEHKIAIFNLLLSWQIGNDTWTITNNKGERYTLYLGIVRVEREGCTLKAYNIVLGKLLIKFGFFG